MNKERNADIKFSFPHTAGYKQVDLTSRAFSVHWSEEIAKDQEKILD